MRKMGMLLMCFILCIGNVGFADLDISHENVARTINQVKLFELPEDGFCLRAIDDIDYHAGEEAIYVLAPYCNRYSGSRKNQYVFDLAGNSIANPEYPVASEGVVRSFIEFDGDQAYSLEIDIDSFTAASDVLNVTDLNTGTALSSEPVSVDRGGFKVSGNRVVYNIEKSYQDSDFGHRPNFYVGTLEPYTASSGSTSIYSDTGRVMAFDLNPSGTELIYGSYTCGGENPGIRIRSVDIATGAKIDEFVISDTVYDSDEGMQNAAWSLYATKDYIVVLSRFVKLEKGRIQRFTYDGELIDQVETNYFVNRMTEGPNGSTIYIEKRFDEEGCFGSFDIVQINWPLVKAELTGRPRSLISERTVGGRTTAVFRDDGFGLLSVEDPETGEMNYIAPLKSDENKVRLRIPFADLLAKMNAGAENLLITYREMRL